LKIKHFSTVKGKIKSSCVTQDYE